MHGGLWGLQHDQEAREKRAKSEQHSAPVAPSLPPGADGSDTAKGLQGAIDRLQVVAEEKAGTAEEIAAVFVAALRALGLLVRFVRILEPLPLRPTLRAAQPWVPPHVKQQRGSRKRPPTTTLDPLDPVSTSSPAGVSSPSAKQNGGASNGEPEAGRGATGSRGRGRGRPGGKRKVPEAGSAEEARTAKRKGDDEFERQLAMAMEATAAQDQAKPKAIKFRQLGADGTLPHPQSPAPDLSTQPVNASSPAKGKSPLIGAHSGIAASHWGRRFRGEGVGQAWAEVYCDSAAQGKWIHVDPHMGWVDMPERVETATVRGAPMAYIVGCCGGGAKDVTQRYVSSFITAEKNRDGTWWDETLRPLRAHQVAATRQHEAQQTQPGPSSSTAPSVGQQQSAAGQPQATGVREEEMRAQREDAELQQRVTSEKRGMPTTVDGFKVHPVYVLERHIGKYQALAPGTKKSGLHRGEAFFHRTALSELHTADRWQREGREVLAHMRDQPAKINRRRGFKLPPGIGGTPTAGKEDVAEEAAGALETQGLPEEGMTKLYGQWQTRVWAAPIASGGLVPKNERGNVHAPPFASALPVGTVHLQMPRLGPVCRRLGVDYAAAMTGFEIRGGRSVPVIDGVVICKENEASVLEAYIEDERKREEAVQQKRMEAAAATWRALLKAVWSRMRVRANYGPAAGPSAGIVQARFAPMEKACRPENIGTAFSEAEDLGSDPSNDPANKDKAADAGRRSWQEAGAPGQFTEPGSAQERSPRNKRAGTQNSVRADNCTLEEQQQAAGNMHSGVHVETEEI
ncbi:hypothetical protein WJX84_000716 [Apatococcus fuscideae]|uniref:Uncharacterized protein n=1 Tax=Apatococcus fuscideae TaxID=2026836 RepID=A0AAW1SW43_9CHLO